MTDAPERIWVQWPHVRGAGLAFSCQARPPAWRHEYVRADRITALEAENGVLRTEKHADAEAIAALTAERDALAAKLKDVMIGGNHLAHHLPETVPPPETHPLDALEELGGGVQYDIWCAWRSIMLARDALAAIQETAQREKGDGAAV